MPARIQVRIPDLGDFKSVDVVDVLGQVGDVVEVDTPLVTLETEKATMDVPSTAAGRIVAVQIAKGAKVSSGSAVVGLEPVADAGTDPTVRQPVLTDAALLAAAASADAARAA